MSDLNDKSAKTANVQANEAVNNASETVGGAFHKADVAVGEVARNAKETTKEVVDAAKQKLHVDSNNQPAKS